MSRAFVNEDAGGSEPRYRLPSRDDPGYDEAAAWALLQGANAGDSSSRGGRRRTSGWSSWRSGFSGEPQEVPLAGRPASRFRPAALVSAEEISTHDPFHFPSPDDPRRGPRRCRPARRANREAAAVVRGREIHVGHDRASRAGDSDGGVGADSRREPHPSLPLREDHRLPEG